MIQRDEHGIICQPQDEFPFLDGGDSARSMSISGLEDEEDSKKLCMFLALTGLRYKLIGIVRHPFQNHVTKEGKVFNKPEHSSRDLLVAYCVCPNWSTEDAANLFKDKWFINNDFLEPSVKLYLYAAADETPSILLRILGNANMWISLFWNTKVRPNEELNQFACMCIRLGWSKRLIAWHPNIEANIRSYWSKYNRPTELGEILIRALKGETK